MSTMKKRLNLNVDAKFLERIKRRAKSLMLDMSSYVRSVLLADLKKEKPR